MTRFENGFGKHKWWILTVLITAPLVALASVPNVFTPNTVISSADVNGNFAGLDTRITALETKSAAAIGVQRSAFSYDATAATPPSMTLPLPTGAYTFTAAGCGFPSGGPFIVSATLQLNGTDSDVAILDPDNGGCFTFVNAVTLTTAGTVSVKFGTGGGQGGAMGTVRWARIVATPVTSASVTTVTN